MNSEQINKAIAALAERDSTMRRLIERCEPYALRPRRDYFGKLVKAIVGQQLATTAASAINARVTEFFGGSPTPGAVIAVNDADLRALGVSRAKITAITDLAEKIVSGELRLSSLARKSDAEIVEALSRVRGVGVWTAQMFLMFTLARPDVLPTTDLGIRKAIHNNYRFADLPTPKQIESLAARRKWAPYRSVASWYLWRSSESERRERGKSATGVSETF
jgi:3-methyladenine DNA glycosylase/8-oxoguanine DNA glycosylase